MRGMTATLVSAGIVLMTSLCAPPAHAADGPWTSGTKSCGAKYVEGKTTGYNNTWVNAAGAYNSGSFSYPGGTVYATGGHSGTVTSYASTHISSWGFVACTYL